jgi:hypothetical protein
MVRARRQRIDGGELHFIFPGPVRIQFEMRTWDCKKWACAEERAPCKRRWKTKNQPLFKDVEKLKAVRQSPRGSEHFFSGSVLLFRSLDPMPAGAYKFPAVQTRENQNQTGYIPWDA